MLNRTTDLSASPRMFSGHQRWDWIGINLWRSHVSVVTLQLAGVDKNPTNNVYDAWSVSGFLMDVGSLCQHRPIASEWLPLIPLNGLKVVNSVWSMLVAILVQIRPLLQLHDPRPHLCSCVILALHSGWLFLLLSSFANFEQVSYHSERDWDLYTYLIILFLWGLLHTTSYCLTTTSTAADYVLEASPASKHFIQVVKIISISLRCEHLCF